MTISAILIALLTTATSAQTPPVNLFDPDAGPLPKDALARIGSPRLRHSGAVTALAYSPDSKWLATASGDITDCTARLWNAATGRERWRVKLETLEHGRLGTAVSLGFSPDGQRLFVIDSKSFRALDLANGREELKHDLTGATPRSPGGVPLPFVGGAIAPNGQSFVLAWTAGRLAICDSTTGAVKIQIERPSQQHQPVPIVFSPDSRRLLLGSALVSLAYVFDAQSGERIALIQLDNARMDSLRFTSTGEIVGTLMRQGQPGRAIGFVDAETGKLKRFVETPRDTMHFALSPDEKVIATANGSFSRSELIDAKSGKPIDQLPTMPRIRHLEFSPDGKLLAGLGAAKEVITVWDVPARRFHAVSPDPWVSLEPTFRSTAAHSRSILPVEFR